MPKIKMEVQSEVKTTDINIPVAGAVDRADIQVQMVEPHTDMSRDVSSLAAELAFMEEPVTIHLHESTNPNDELYVFCGVNGEYPTPGNPWMKRGTDYTIARKFVLNLLTAKTVSFTQPYRDQPGDQANNLRRHAAAKYPFSIMHDPNPKGGAWMKQVMAGA